RPRCPRRALLPKRTRRATTGSNTGAPGGGRPSVPACSGARARLRLSPASALPADPAVRCLALEELSDLRQLPGDDLQDVVDREDAEQSTVTANHRKPAEPTGPHVAERRLDRFVLTDRGWRRSHHRAHARLPGVEPGREDAHREVAVRQDAHGAP